MDYYPYPRRDTIKNYFPLSNEIFLLGLCPGELAIYSYLLYLEKRKTYQCYPSYKTIGSAVKLATNTVQKYVAMLETRQLITTEPTSVRTKSGRKRNGSLLYTVRLIQEALDLYHARQMARLEDTTARQRTMEKLTKFAHRSPCEPVCATLGGSASPSPRTEMEAMSSE
ncbi:helix-turn-helix domain-containing protein [Dysosmobacter sp.]